jgi:hypothetical protein
MKQEPIAIIDISGISGAQRKQPETKCLERQNNGDIMSGDITAGDITSTGHSIKRDYKSGRTKHPEGPNVRKSKRQWEQNIRRHNIHLN